MRQDMEQVRVDVDVPGVAAKDLQVEVVQEMPCVVQWSTSTSCGEQQRFPEQRVRLGQAIDCEQLSANLSRGVLRLTAPVRPQTEATESRNISITEHDDE
jgi:HSP20 family molecular chaperone IbpA